MVYNPTVKFFKSCLIALVKFTTGYPVLIAVALLTTIIFSPIFIP